LARCLAKELTGSSRSSSKRQTHDMSLLELFILPSSSEMDPHLIRWGNFKIPEEKWTKFTLDLLRETADCGWN